MAKKELELRDGEQIFESKKSGDCWKMPNMILNRQTSGKLYFTDQRIVFFASGLIKTDNLNWEIEMKDIKEVKTCLTPPCFPFGVLITLKNGDKYKLGITGRKKYISWITEHIS